ncbi:MAG: class I SAM-dependent methyltransferase [Thermoplasmata archaeon]
MMEDLRARLVSTLRAPTQRALRSLWSPTRGEYLSSAEVGSPDPAVVLQAMLGDASAELPSSLPELLAHEYSARWQIDGEALRLLSAFVRATKPTRMLETGVADGASTRVILDAMNTNRSGRLDSVDISPTAGALARTSPGVQRWNFTSLPRRGRARETRRIVQSLAPLDVFLHDSDHSYPWQAFEYRTAWDALAPGGWILSDDIDASYAFLDFARRHQRRPWILAGPTKMFGAVRKGT